MAIIKESIHTPMEGVIDYKNIKFTCPECKQAKDLKIPRSIINKARQLTTVSIPKGLVCNHHFQAFVDKNFAIRGYQKVDFELAYDLLKKKKSENQTKKINDNFYESLIIEGNYVEFKHLDLKKFKQIKKNNLYIKEEIRSNPKMTLAVNKVEKLKEKTEMTLEEVYNEFWEFIENDNVEFKDLIEKDYRRNIS